jgi:thiamine biosynthesis lipoprotein
MAVSTAGSYRNYYELDGKRYSHIIDPATGEPVTHKLVSATVITPTALEADALDTALMVMGPERAMALPGAQAGGLSHREDRHGLCRQPHPEFAPYLVRKQP